MILQAYDFYQLYKKNDCILQIGGSDQWGNIVNGVDLIRRILKKEAYGITSPLITLASGAKMGKTESGAIWLNEDMFSAYDYWQFWRNTDDRDVKKFLNFFTEIETYEIDNLFKEESNINNLKILLANEATKILHGDAASKKAEQTAKDTFHGKGLGSNLPEILLKQNDIEKGIKLLEFLSKNQIVHSNSEARRVIENKGLKVNDILVVDSKKILKLTDFTNKILKISYGKKKHYIVKIN
jgi:tyrosyl-tRNA synthetase